MGTIAIWLMAAAPLGAVIVDRVAITVGNKVITESEIDLRIRLTAFENDEKPDFSLASRRRAAQRLIDQKLVEREMDVGRYPRVAPEAAKQSTTSPSMKAYGLTGEDLARDLAWQTELLTFLSLRFRPAVQVTDQDVEKYFKEKSLKGELNDQRAAIEEKLTGERADKELDLWLQDQRKRTRIEYALKDLAEGVK
jgi:prophage tail gpP-like protein